MKANGLKSVKYLTLYLSLDPDLVCVGILIYIMDRRVKVSLILLFIFYIFFFRFKKDNENIVI